MQTWKDTGSIGKELLLYKTMSDEKNIRFTFFTYGDNETNEINLLKEYDEFRVISISRYFKNQNFLLFKSLLVPFLLKKDLDKVSLIKCIQLNGCWVGIILKFLLKTKLYVKTGFDQFIFSLRENKSGFKKVLFYTLTQTAILFANIYVVSSKSDKDFITKRYLFSKKKKIRLRPNWVDEKQIDYKIKNKKFNKKIIAVGRLAEQKNYPYIIDSLSNTDIELDIVGTGDIKESLVSYASRKNAKVNFLGNLDNTDLLKLLKSYKYFVLASTFEGNPKVLLEAMLMGCIPIVSAIPNNLEIVKNDYNGYTFEINSSSSNQLLDTILDCEETNSYLRLSLCSYEYLNKNNSLTLASTQEYSDYLELADRGKFE